VRVVALAAAAVAVLVLGSFFGYVRAAVAVAMFCAIAVFGTRYLRFMVIAPPDPEITDVSRFGFKYVCHVCGLELRVEKAAKDRPPNHCAEPMVLTREDGKPPLRPV
jgi:hypothetical protein